MHNKNCHLSADGSFFHYKDITQSGVQQAQSRFMMETASE